MNRKYARNISRDRGSIPNAASPSFKCHIYVQLISGFIYARKIWIAIGHRENNIRNFCSFLWRD
jgi:hypothetical protein